MLLSGARAGTRNRSLSRSRLDWLHNTVSNINTYFFFFIKTMCFFTFLFSWKLSYRSFNIFMLLDPVFAWIRIRIILPGPGSVPVPVSYSS